MVWHPIESLESRILFDAFQVSVNFQPAKVPTPAGYMADTGALYGDRGNGYTYGWTGKLPAVTRQQNAAKPDRNGPDLTYDTFAILNPSGRGSQWQIAVPDGQYTVQVRAGSPTVFAARYRVDVEGALVLDGRAAVKNQWVDGTAEITVTNGLLTITSPRGTIDRLDTVTITAVTSTTSLPPVSPPVPPSPPPPSVTPPSPPAPLTWQQVASAPVAMTEGQDATIDGKVYVFGGHSVTNPSWQANSQLNVYDPAANTWTALAPVPEKLSEAAVATDGVDLYVAGGYVTNANGQQTFATTDAWKYDPASNTWNAFVSLPAPRAVGAMVYLDGELQYFGGSDLSRVDCTDHWILNLDSSNPQWTTSTPLPVAVNRLGGVVLNGDVYAVGGQSGYDNNGVPTSAVYMWNPQNPARWTAVASMPEPHSHIGSATVVIDGMIIVAGGDDAVGDFLNNVVAYDPTTNSCKELTPLPSPRFAPIVAAIGDQVLVTDGYNDGIMSSTTWESSPLQT
jgi:N-acetylneuraminic acid mutarotase